MQISKYKNCSYQKGKEAKRRRKNQKPIDEQEKQISTR